jgi:hypothetical protein
VLWELEAVESCAPVEHAFCFAELVFEGFAALPKLCYFAYLIVFFVDHSFSRTVFVAFKIFGQEKVVRCARTCAVSRALVAGFAQVRGIPSKCVFLAQSARGCFKPL